MSLLSSIKNIAAGGEGKTINPYQPYKPFIRANEARQYYDITQLYGKDAYDRPGLGYAPSELEGMYGQGRDLAAGEEAASQQRLMDQYRSPTGLGLNSGMYARAQQRESLAAVLRANELRRKMVIANAQQKRADLRTRLSAVGQAYGQGVGTYNQYVGGYNQRQRLAQGPAQALFAGAGAAGGAY